MEGRLRPPGGGANGVASRFRDVTRRRRRQRRAPLRFTKYCRKVHLWPGLTSNYGFGFIGAASEGVALFPGPAGAVCATLTAVFINSRERLILRRNYLHARRYTAFK